MKQYIEYTKTITEVYEVEADTVEEAKELVQKNHNTFAPNIIHKEETENFRNVNGRYRSR